MDEMVSFCGLLCNECGAFIATQDDDDAKRAGVAQLWSRTFKVHLKPGDINCSGCLSDTEPLFSHCRVCQVRKCGKAKAIENCAYCGEYACEELEKIFQMAPDAKRRLDQIRGKM